MQSSRDMEAMVGSERGDAGVSSWLSLGGGVSFYGFNFLTVHPQLPPTKYFSMNPPQSCYLILEFQVQTDRSNVSTAMLWMFPHAYDETGRHTWQLKVLMDTTGAANDNYKQVNISDKGCLGYKCSA